MYADEFARWLEQSYRQKCGNQLDVRSRNDAKSRCKRVEKFEGDLDLHFDQDEMQELLRLLIYSQQDANAGAKPRHSVPIKGNLINGTYSLRSAINLYRTFRNSYKN